MHKIEYGELLDKIHGCWYGKCLGGAAGAPVEGLKELIHIDDFTKIYNPDIPNDDLDLQLLWLDVLEKKGTIISSDDLAQAWEKKCSYVMSEYGYFIKNYLRGVRAPYSGIINNSFFKEGMGCPIRAEIWGMISVGNPQLASQYAYMDATLDHADNSVYAEQMLAVMCSEAFFESDTKKLLIKGMESIPKSSKLYKCAQLVLNEYVKDTPYIDVRTKILNKFGHPDFTNSIQNLGFSFIGLLYGESDMRKTINVTLKCGYDVDCTCGCAASIVGIINGYNKLGELKGLIKDYFVCGIDVVRPSDSIKRLAYDTLKVALATPNYEIEVLNLPEELKGVERPENFVGFELVKADKEGLKKELKKLKPLVWKISLPFYEKPDIPTDSNETSLHMDGSDLPGLAWMVNNKVEIDKEYINEEVLDLGELSCVVESYEDFIEIDNNLTIQGQFCCYAQSELDVDEDMKLWTLIGNNDGFVLWIDGNEVMRKDEIRYWTPYNNFTLLDLKKGKHIVTIKLLKRTENLKFAIGYRHYCEGQHWHCSRWYIQ